MQANSVAIETHVGEGLPSTTIVGLPEGAVRESRDRVRSALSSSGFGYPEGRVVINLAPGNLAKTGSSLDLPIAISLLAATGKLTDSGLDSCEFLGELGLYGELRQVSGTLSAAIAAQDQGRRLIVPSANLTEASLVSRTNVITAPTLLTVVAALKDPQDRLWRTRLPSYPRRGRDSSNRLDQVLGQTVAKRALTIAAAGGHHLLMVGPPGTGKSMLARGFIDLLPDLSSADRMDVAAVYSAAGLEREDYCAPPMRDPHHSASAQALIGGGRIPVPGEVALAHRGVLFMDELPHFKPSVLDHLREPIETGEAVVSRANYKVRFPCRFQLLAAMNPCPAGRSCKTDACRCTTNQVRRYQSRISGPLLDRIDLHVSVPELPQELLTETNRAAPESSLQELKKLVIDARHAQQQRQNELNTNLSGSSLEEHIRAAGIDKKLLARAIEKYQLSARSYHKLWRISRTIADLEGANKIDSRHFAEALSYRALDWEQGL